MNISLDKMVIFFDGEVHGKEESLFKKEECFFPAESYWRIISNSNDGVIMQNTQSKEKKIISYSMLGRIFSKETNLISVTTEKNVPKIIKLS